MDRLAEHALEDRRQAAQLGRDGDPLLDGVELGREGRRGGDEDQRRDHADDQRGAPAVAERLPEDRAEPEQPAEQARCGQGDRRSPGRLRGRAHRAAPAASAGRLAYSDRKTSSSDGSRLTKSTRSYWPASRTTGAIGPVTSIRSVRPSSTRLTTPSIASNAAAGDGRGEAQLHLVGGDRAHALDGVDADDPALADDRDAVAGPLDLADDVRAQEDRPALALASNSSSLKVCWTSGSSPDVGSSRISSSGRCWSAHDEPDLLLVALRVLAEAAARVEVEALDELVDVGLVDAAAQVREVADRLGAREPVVEVPLARQVAEPAMDRDRVGRCLDAEHLRDAGGRPDEVEQDPDRRGLAGAVRAEEAEDLALVDDEVDVDDAPVLAVRLGELLGLDDAVTCFPSSEASASSLPARACSGTCR